MRGVLVIILCLGGCGMLLDAKSRLYTFPSVPTACTVSFCTAIIHSCNSNRGCSNISMTRVWIRSYSPVFKVRLQLVLLDSISYFGPVLLLKRDEMLYILSGQSVLFGQ